MLTVDCGQVAYEQAWHWQRLLVAARADDLIDDVLLTLTHPPVYTAGRRADVEAHVLGTTPIPVVRVDRGGDVTYHGPGQLVAYPIVRLVHAKAVRPYVEALQTACIRTAASFGVTGHTQAGRTGVWVGDEKLAAIGIRVERKVTSHGLAFNVAPDLRHYDGIVPCGLADAGVCSLASLGVETTLPEVRKRLVAHLSEILGRRAQPVTLADLGLIRRIA